jgi:hypothetical protein
MTIENTQTIGDAYWGKQGQFKVLKEKSDRCLYKYKEITNMVLEHKKIFQLVFKNFNPERKKLGIFVLNTYYDSRKGNKKWIHSETEVEENKRWFYNEVCLNTTGISLLQIGAVQATDILGERENNWLYCMETLKDKIASDKFKEVLKEEKLDILNKVLDGIEVLKSTSDFIQEKKLKYFEIKTDNNAFKKKNVSSRYIQLEVNTEDVRCSLLNTKEKTYNDIDFYINNLSHDDAIIAEQIQEELISALDWCYSELETTSNKIREHLIKLKGYFTKQLIIMNLTQGDSI